MAHAFSHRPMWLCAVAALFVGNAVGAGLQETGASTSESLPSPVVREWRHPMEWYPKSVQRWFRGLPPQLRYSEVRFQHGDDVRWAQPTWDDSDWKRAGLWDLPARAGVDWIRIRVRMGADGAEPLPSGIMVSTVRAYDLFWDGVKLSSSGVPANTFDAEVAGRIDDWFSIPAALCGPGEHVVAFRTSSYRCGFPAATSGFRFLVDSSAVLRGMVLREAFVPTLAAGALFMVGIASLIMWLLAARRLTLLLLGGVCFSGAIMQSLQAVRWFFAYPADWHYPVLTAMTSLVGVQGVLTIAMVVVHFEVPRRRWLLAALVPVFALVAWLSPERQNLEGVRILAVALTISLACAVWAVWRNRRGAWPVVVGVAASTVLLAIEAEDYRASFFIKFLPALVGLIASLASQLQHERKRAREVELTAARLECELLKKNLQPHFLFNTLTALSEVVEQNPRMATQLINDLADEFRTVARVSAEKLIPLAQEIELCRAHLRVMSVRTACPWTLEVEGALEEAFVPPAVFLTLIENGFVHQHVRGEAAVFRLRGERVGDELIRYTFLSPGALEIDPRRPAGGTGLRYVKARLEESFPSRWAFRSEPVAAGWQTVIEVAAADAERGVGR